VPAAQGASRSALILRTDRSEVFRQFFVDVQNGLGCIGGAAAVIPEIYSHTDDGSAASVGDVSFAFHDNTSTPPRSTPQPPRARLAPPHPQTGRRSPVPALTLGRQTHPGATTLLD
jgi:hypothetical protein